ncbi:MAG TPA: response regulator transcription factor [Chthoniobacteraceae bacterium]
MLRSAPDIKCPHAIGNAEHACRLLAAEEPPDVMLLDVNLPGMSGIEALPRFKELAPKMLVLILTVFEDSKRIAEAIRAGADGYLLKTADFHSLLAAIREAYAGGAPMSPAVARKAIELVRDAKKPVVGTLAEPLTGREREVLTVLCEGLSIGEVSARLGVSVHTVDFHLRNLYSKLGVHSATGAVAKAVREGLV